MKKLWIVPIEPIDTRYTKQWYNHIPTALETAANKEKLNLDIIVVDGEQVPPAPSPGAFLDFGATNIYKSSQLAAIAHEFQQGNVSAGDKFLFTDAWNPTVIQLKYMSELLNIPIEIHGMWHAGSYDPQDFLGRLIGNKPWVRYAEKSMVECYDTNWFATNFHLDLFMEGLYGTSMHNAKHVMMGSNKVDLTGWPMDYLVDALKPYSTLTKKPQIVFPHRIAPEKQLEIFKDLAANMPEYEWIVCQETALSKHEYHTILGESKMVFSANLQETFGISMIEGLLCNTIPLVPNRLSYVEMYDDQFKYPSEWTENFSSYEANRGKLIDGIRNIMSIDNGVMNAAMQSQLMKLNRYIYATQLINKLLTYE